MKTKNILKKYNNFFSSLLIAILLSVSLSAILLMTTTTKLLSILIIFPFFLGGTLLTFYPFIVYIYPHLMGKMSVYLLNTLLIIFSLWLNFTLLHIILSYSAFSYNLLNLTLSQISIWGSIYIMTLNALIANFILISKIDFYKEESLF
ncbi:MAG TPA: hypothetical protein ENK82_03475 [Campylobacterales bacterium]|nr:hypothetical protein [Campylobacterales bacterium]HHS92381.1 hypothetical protein [Campylobacterales bacterium]